MESYLRHPEREEAWSFPGTDSFCPGKGEGAFERESAPRRERGEIFFGAIQKRAALQRKKNADEKEIPLPSSSQRESKKKGGEGGKRDIF